MVFEGSDAALTATLRLPRGMAALRQTSIASGVLSASGEKVIFIRDHMFKKPISGSGGHYGILD